MTDRDAAEGRAAARLGVDIGGTFTDVALEAGDRRFSAKILTTPDAPERAVIAAMHAVLRDAGLTPGDLSIIIHGTTLATNAIIERKGARTALVTTEGFRDTVEIRHENRFEQYDVNIDLPPPLVPRRLRFVVPERIDARGRVITPLDEAAVEAVAVKLSALGIESVAIGFLHSYTKPAHETRTRDILAARLPGVSFTLSCEVSPEMREYERFSTACANAYVQPMIGRYLRNLEERLGAEGFGCPLFLMLSGGGLTTVATAIRFPVRLVESGPAGGAIFASHIARQCGLDKVLSYDMGGTTAKICLIDDYRPQTSRAFEVARVYRFKKGSGLPLRIPVIEMVEIGAGGGSIARVDRLRRITVGPDSAGAAPGPACYGRGGEAPTVTDADLVLGRIDPTGFSGGKHGAGPRRRRGRACGATSPTSSIWPCRWRRSGSARSSTRTWPTRRACTRSRAARTRAAARWSRLVGRRRCMPRGWPKSSGSTGCWCRRRPGSARRSGFCGRRSPTRSCARNCSGSIAFDAAAANALLAAMRAEAEAIVRRGEPEAALTETRSAFMRVPRPGPRDRGEAAGAALPAGGCRGAIGGVRGGLSRAVQPGHSRGRGRGAELGAAAERPGA